MLGCVLVVIGGCAGSTVLVSTRLSARVAEGRRAGDRVRAAILQHGARRWERPVLRGEPQARNAANDERRAIAELLSADRADPERGWREETEAALTAIESGAATASSWPDVLSRTERHRDAIRRATQGAFAVNVLAPNEDVAAPSDPTTLGSLFAARLLLASTASETPARCMQIAADVVRLGQDLSAGSTLVSRMLLDASARRAGPILMRCAARATPDEIAMARAEVESLAASSPSAAWTFEIEALGVARAMALALPESPWPTSRDHIERLSTLEAALFAIDHQLGVASRWRVRDSEGPTGVVRGTEDEERRLTESDNPLLAIAGLPYGAFGRRSARVDALLRAMVLGLDALEIAKRGDGTLPAELPRRADARFHDPLAREPLRWTVEAGARRATIAWTATQPASARAPRPGEPPQDALIVASQ